VRVLFWNAFRGIVGWERVAARIPFADLDIVALVEAGKPTPEHEQFWRSRCLGMTVRGFGRHMWLMARGSIELSNPLEGYWGARINQARVALPQGTLTLVVVDLPSYLCRSRRPGFDALQRVVQQLDPAEPALVVGDFNTPRESVLMTPLRARFRHAFETAGRGLIDTWPVVATCISIDHAWVGPGLDVLRCQHRGTLVSDHRQVYFEIARSAKQ